MTWFQQIIDAIRNLVQWWFIVLPWEQAVRIRLGNRVVLFGKGIHFRAPLIDRVYIQNVRLRIVALNPQTLTTLDSKTISCVGSVRYRLKDILKLYETLHQPDPTIRQHVEGLLAEFVVRHNLHDCAPSVVSEHVTAQLDLSRYGLNDATFFLTDFAVVKTYRLIGGNMEKWTGGREIDTELQATASGQPR